MGRLAGLTIAALSLLLSTVGLPFSWASPPHAQPFLAGWLLSGDPVEETLRRAPFLKEVSPQLFRLTPGGKIEWVDGEATVTWANKLLTAASESGIAVVPHIISPFELPALVKEVLKDETTRRNHIDALVKIVAGGRFQFPGLEIDYEGLDLEDGPRFTDFIAELNKRLKSLTPPRRLYVDVPLVYLRLRDRNPFDLKGLSQNTDFIKVLAYDLTWPFVPGESGLMAHSPYWWVNSAVFHLISPPPVGLGLDPQKVILGLPLYGYIWREKEGRWTTRSDAYIYFQELFSRSRRELAKGPLAFFFDKERSRTPFGVLDRLQVWYEDSRSLAWKAGLVLKYRLAGLSLWRLNGLEDPAIYETISRLLLTERKLLLKFSAGWAPWIQDWHGRGAGILPETGEPFALLWGTGVESDAEGRVTISFHQPYPGAFLLGALARRTGPFLLEVEYRVGRDVKALFQVEDRAETGQTLQSLLLIQPGREGEMISVIPRDTGGPKVFVTIQGEPAGRSSFFAPVTILAWGADEPGGSGLEGIELSLDEGRTWEQYLGPLTLYGSGERSFRLRGRDESGNPGPEKEVKITWTETKGK